MSCARAADTPSSALRRPAAAAEARPLVCPPLNSVWESDSPNRQVFSLPNGRLRKLAKGSAALEHSTAFSSESSRCSTVSCGCGVKWAHFAEGVGAVPSLKH